MIIAGIFLKTIGAFLLLAGLILLYLTVIYFTIKPTQPDHKGKYGNGE